MKVNEIILSNQNKTPFYYYDLELLKKTLNNLKVESSKYNFHVYYAIKANVNPKIMQIIAKYGLGADCVSANEILYAKKMGFAMNKTIFSGVGKTDKEINIALDEGIFCLNVESKEELFIVNKLAKAKNKKINIALRINPNIKAKTHAYITTGLAENKFGIAFSMLDEVLTQLSSYKNVNLISLHFHIGSQITDLAVFKDLCQKVNQVQNKLKEKNLYVAHINVGGGLGINYKNPIQEPIADFVNYFALFNKYLKLEKKQKLHFELGRSVVGNCGFLISKVTYVKQGENKDFIILDAGMTELVRPALYNSYHKIKNITSNEPSQKYDVVGPICETSDCFAKNIYLPKTKRGDLIMIFQTGAYGQVMASKYNLRDPIKSLYSDKSCEYNT